MNQKLKFWRQTDDGICTYFKCSWLLFGSLPSEVLRTNVYLSWWSVSIPVATSNNFEPVIEGVHCIIIPFVDMARRNRYYSLAKGRRMLDPPAEDQRQLIAQAWCLVLRKSPVFSHDNYGNLVSLFKVGKIGLIFFVTQKIFSCP